MHGAGRSGRTLRPERNFTPCGPKAVATGHSILVVIWHLLSTGEIYTDLGADYFDKRRTNTAHRNRLVAQLEALGLDVTLTPKAA